MCEVLNGIQRRAASLLLVVLCLGAGQLLARVVWETVAVYGAMAYGSNGGYTENNAIIQQCRTVLFVVCSGAYPSQRRVLPRRCDFLVSARTLPRGSLDVFLPLFVEPTLY